MVNGVTFMTSSCPGSEARPPKNMPSSLSSKGPNADAKAKTKTKKDKNDLSDSTSSDEEELNDKKRKSIDEDNSSDWSAKDSIDLEIKEMRRQEKLKAKQAQMRKENEKTELGQ